MPRVRSIGGGSAEYVSFDGLWRADGAGQATRGADGEGELGVANIWWTLLHLFFLFRGCDLLIFSVALCSISILTTCHRLRR